MSLKFLGNGSGFTNSHTNAYFETKEDFIIIDLSMLNLQKILSLKPYEKNVYMVITHMHDDHTSGLGLFIQYLYYLYNTKLNIVIPQNLKSDILTELNIKGIDINICNIILANNLNKNWLIETILTSHSPELKNKCFSYLFNIDNKICLYTGDTNTLIPYKKYLNNIDELYVDISVSYGNVHLKFDDVKDELLEISKNIKVYLMHIDNIEKLKELIKNTKLKIVEVI